MNKIKIYSGLIVSFAGGLLVASLYAKYGYQSSVNVMQSNANLQTVNAHLIQEDSIKLPVKSGQISTGFGEIKPPKQYKISKKIFETDQAGYSFDENLPTIIEVSNPPGNIEMIEIPLDSEITDEPPEGDFSENNMNPINLDQN